MKCPLSLLLSFFLMLSLAACDYIGGARHFAELRSVPSMECVTKSLQSMPGISALTATDSLESGAMTIAGEQSPEKVVTFEYLIPATGGSNAKSSPKALGVKIRFLIKKRDKAEYTHSYTQQNSTPLQAEVDIVLAMMDKIEKKLFEDCEIKELNDRVDRYCTSSLECARRQPIVPE